MKQIYIAISVLLFSLGAFVYTSYASSALSSSCNKSCGSAEECIDGADYLKSAWTNCHIYPDGSCAVYGAHC